MSYDSWDDENDPEAQDWMDRQDEDDETPDEKLDHNLEKIREIIGYAHALVDDDDHPEIKSLDDLTALSGLKSWIGLLQTLNRLGVAWDAEPMWLKIDGLTFEGALSVNGQEPSSVTLCNRNDLHSARTLSTDDLDTYRLSSGLLEMEDDAEQETP